MNQDNGGIIGKINTSTTTVASGVWTLQDQFEAQSSSTWPLAFPQTTIANGCRFSVSDDSLSKTYSSSGSTKTWTLSTWIKRSNLDTSQNQKIFGTNYASTSEFMIIFNNSGTDEDKINILNYTGGGGAIQANATTARLFRDTSAWYHLVVALDTTQSSESDRLKFYINGSLATLSGTIPSQNADLVWNNSSHTLYIGEGGSQSVGNFQGYLCETIFVDGQALTPTSLGAFNPVTNIWEPIAYTGTYGTNGFKLNYSDSSNLGDDTSGNGNDWTVNNLTSIDQSTDTPSNNFATLNPLASVTDAPTFSDGNLTIDIPNAGAFGAQSTIGVSSGKWYAEFKLVATSDNDMAVGVNSDGDAPRSDLGPGFGTHSTGYRETGKLAVNGTDDISYGNSYAVNDIVGIALDLDNNKLYFSKNGVFQNSGDPTSGSTGTGALSLTAASSTQSGAYFFNPGCHSGSQNGDWSANFGSPPYTISSGNADANGHGNFEYAVPSGYFALCTKNLSEHG